MMSEKDLDRCYVGGVAVLALSLVGAVLLTALVGWPRGLAVLVLCLNVPAYGLWVLPPLATAMARWWCRWHQVAPPPRPARSATAVGVTMAVAVLTVDGAAAGIVWPLAPVMAVLGYMAPLVVLVTVAGWWARRKAALPRLLAARGDG
jgi:hypothetical protein